MEEAVSVRKVVVCVVHVVLVLQVVLLLFHVPMLVVNSSASPNTVTKHRNAFTRFLFLPLHPKP